MPENAYDFFDKEEEIHYRNLPVIKRFITRYNKIKSRYYIGTSLKIQKKVAKEIKKARIMGLLPFVLSD